MIVKNLLDACKGNKGWYLYKKKPVTIKAVELTEEVEIETREGILKGYKGDFLIEGIEGEIYPCGKDIFRKTYEALTPKDLRSVLSERQSDSDQK